MVIELGFVPAGTGAATLESAPLVTSMRYAEIS